MRRESTRKREEPSSKHTVGYFDPNAGTETRSTDAKENDAEVGSILVNPMAEVGAWGSSKASPR